MAERFPAASITAVSNAAPQRNFIERQAEKRGLNNLRVITADINHFRPDHTFDRVISIEMFEHMQNIRQLLDRIHDWLRPDGLLMVHMFCHHRVAYPFQTTGAADWMGRHFFTGGLMPSADLLDRFRDPLQPTERWHWPGTHYQRTAEAWLNNLDANRDTLLPILRDVYGPEHAERWLQRWRIFFMACAELFGFRNGTEWGVVHTQMVKPLQPQTKLRQNRKQRGLNARKGGEVNPA